MLNYVFHLIFSSTTVFKINNKKNILAINQHIRMISEGSCDPEDCSNDHWKFNIYIMNKWHFKIIYILNWLIKYAQS